MTLLKKGMSGPEVRDVQGLLNQKVSVHPLLSVDGIFGPKTEARVVMFQRRAGLVPDGIVGPATGKALVGAVLNALIRRDY
jgi:peptidoglycan hydrolase-like protein with peptidoglycan-binding domain